MHQRPPAYAAVARPIALPVGALIVLALALATFLALRPPSATPVAPVFRPAPLTPMPSSSAIEDRFGIRFTQIGVTADGGMVDVRYQVLDPDKALPLPEQVDQQNPPVLVADANGARLSATALMPTKHELITGRTYFILYQNTNGAIRHGGRVTIEVDGLRLEHAPAI